MLSKREVRQSVKRRLAALTGEERAFRNRAIAERLFRSEEYRGARSIFLFYSMPEEVDTHSILSDALAEGKEVFLPRIEGEKMLLVPYREEDSLLPNRYGILEPMGDAAAAQPELALIPLLAYDRKRGRLGRGKGYYDRFLASFSGTSIALAFSEQEWERVPTEAFDRRPDIIITDKERIG